MLIRKKYDLPTMWKFQSKKFDIKRLQEEALKLANDYGNVMETNKALCSNNHKLVMSVYKHFKQINLTEFDPGADSPTVESCEVMGKTAGTGDESISKIAKYRLKSRLGKGLAPGLNEHNYNTPTDKYIGSYFQEVVESFNADAIRVRLVRLDPGKTLTPHIDYDPTYAVRVIIPIFAEEEATNYFWRKGKQEAYHLKADGSAYFLNIGFKHTVVNSGNTPRVSLMFSLKDQSDLQEIEEADWNGSNNMGDLAIIKNYEEHKAYADAQSVAV
mgnify:FL=1|tara:strand:- start:2775 stop:3590 length:816 start_codon:yes stop_codon:yes gene_type:complete